MSGCPVKHGNSPTEPIGAQTPAAPQETGTATTATTATATVPTECPVKHKPTTATEQQQQQPQQQPQQQQSECPVKPKARDIKDEGQRLQNVYDVYTNVIDPRNNMPKNLSQEPAPGQKIPISTERVQSNIPKGGTESTWLYPSPQMFYNALRRKGKDDGFKEEDAEVVVSIHNNMNEKTWKKVMEWEKLHEAECSQPKLSHFMGLPTDLSPKAYLKTFLGWVTPFDRHDWFVDRCGKEVRYIIDYYYDGNLSKKDEKPALQSDNSIKSIHVDVRPAVDSFESLVDRLKMFPQRVRDYNDLRSRGFNPYESAKKQHEVEQEELRKIDEKRAQTIQEKCANTFQKLTKCEGEEECQKASLAVEFCMSKVICPEKADEFMVAIGSSSASDAEVNRALEGMSVCVQKFKRRLQRPL